ncbi:MAG: peptide ABC transporter substrate-binding protein [Clostridia bacterium]|nr:peptide ABC transporter substrate-binding protein [Clostridia bacterium]
MKKAVSILLAVLMALSCVLVLTACDGNNDPTDPATNGDATPVAQSLAVCLASEPDTIDPALNSAVDGATLVIHAFSGLIGYQQTADGNLELYAECAKEIPEGTVGEDGKVTYVFELKDGLKWSDGSDLTAADFVYAWNRAASPLTAADYGYMFDVIDGYAEMNEIDDNEELVNPDAKLNVTADGNTLTVVTNVEVPYFYELLAFPTYMPVKQDVVEANPDGWATDPSTYVSNGAYTMTEWAHDSKIVYTKNENYYNADAVTMDTIEFYLSDDANNMLANFKNGDWLFIDDVPNAEMAALEADYADEYFVGSQLGTYYVCFNVNKSLLPADSTLEGAEKEAAEAEVRSALALLLDRNYIVKEISKAGEVPASSFVALGLTDADGSEFYKNAGSSEEYIGYFNTAAEAFESNCAAAVETLKKYYTYDEATAKFTNFPSIEYIYNDNQNHQLIGEYIQQAFAAYGITVSITSQEWNTFLNTRKNGEYNIARNGWLSDYNDPISFLDMWLTVSGNNDIQFGKDAHKDLAAYSVDLTELGIDYVVENGTWAETYDYIINLVKTTTDTELRYALMHVAEDLLMSTGAICPIYYYTDVFMCDSSVSGWFTSPLGYKYFMYSTVAE